MSRGPGVRQRELLDALEQHPRVWVTAPGMPTAFQAAARRAAHVLERQGRIELGVLHDTDGHPRLVASRPGEGVGAFVVQGLDGKTYMGPARPDLRQRP